MEVITMGKKAGAITLTNDERNYLETQVRSRETLINLP
jgi:hypothetical protein